MGTADEKCCGITHAIGNTGNPLVLACILCPNASIYYAAEPGYRERSQRRIIDGELP